MHRIMSQAMNKEVGFSFQQQQVGFSFPITSVFDTPQISLH